MPLHQFIRQQRPSSTVTVKLLHHHNTRVNNNRTNRPRRKNILHSNDISTMAPAPNLKSDDYYENLGIPKSADDAAIKKAYKKLAVKVRKRPVLACVFT